jgi:TolB-like protein/Tfp pilus assembly protein PilF
MKRCPECRRDYADDSLFYCLEDGAALIQGSVPSPDEPATAVIASPHVTSEDPTRSFRSSDIPAGSIPAIQETQSKPKTKMLLILSLAAIGVLAAGFLGYRYLGSARAGQIDSIAVMPLVNASGDADSEYLSDGMTETLINSLAQIPNLAVKGRGSVFRYKGKETEPKQIAAELGVEAVLNGRLLKRGDSVTLSLDLVEAHTGNQIWGEQYIRNISDIAALQKEIARDVSNKLKTKLTGAEQQNLAKGHTADPEAYQLYLQGLYYWNKRTDEGIQKAEEFFLKAIYKDPTYSLAHVGLATSYVVSDRMAEFNYKGKAAALKALELDPSLGEAHAVLANIAFYFEWDWPTAEREYKRAIELSPNYATTYHWYGETLANMGKFDESFAMYQKAVELDPVSLAIATDQGRAYYLARRFDRAIEILKRVEEIDPSYQRTYFYLSTVYEEKGMFPEAIETIRKGQIVRGRDTELLTPRLKKLSDSYAASGPAGYWRTALELTLEAAKRTGEPPNDIELAFLYCQIGDNDRAFQYLEKAFQKRRTDMVGLQVEPAWDTIRDDPRFVDLVRRVGVNS